MRAQVLGKIDELRFVESADELHRLEEGALHRRRIARVGAEIAAAQLMGWKKRDASRKIHNKVARGAGAIASGAERKPVPGRRGGQRVVVDAELEGAEMALGGR